LALPKSGAALVRQLKVETPTLADDLESDLRALRWRNKDTSNFPRLGSPVHSQCRRAGMDAAEAGSAM
jgi:hypothetical protein